MKHATLKYLMLMLLAFIPIPWLSVNATDYMNVYLTSQNSFQSINIEGIDKITFPSEEEVNIVISGVSTPMAIDNIEVITFGNTDITAIEDSKEETSAIEITYIKGSGKVRITSPEAINLVQLYNMQGVLVQTQSPKTQIATLDVSNYANGIYIVAVQSNGKVETKKIIK